MMLANSEHLGMTIIWPSKIETYEDIQCPMKVKQWVAVISGICPKFGFKREFIKKQSSKVSPTVYWNIYPLQRGKIYQFNGLYVAKKNYSNGYLYTSPCGELISVIEKEEVRVILNMPSKKKNEIKDKLLEERSNDKTNFADNDNCPF